MWKGHLWPLGPVLGFGCQHRAQRVHVKQRKVCRRDATLFSSNERARRTKHTHWLLAPASSPYRFQRLICQLHFYTYITSSNKQTKLFKMADLRIAMCRQWLWRYPEWSVVHRKTSRCFCNETPQIISLMEPKPPALRWVIVPLTA